MYNVTSNIENSRIAFAVNRFFVHKGCDVVGLDDFEVDFLTIDAEGNAALVAVSASDKGFESVRPSREEYEAAMLSLARMGYLEPDTAIRFDAVSICVIDDGKAIVRHHMSCFDEEPEI